MGGSQGDPAATTHTSRDFLGGQRGKAAGGGRDTWFGPGCAPVLACPWQSGLLPLRTWIPDLSVGVRT